MTVPITSQKITCFLKMISLAQVSVVLWGIQICASLPQSQMVFPSHLRKVLEDQR